MADNHNTNEDEDILVTLDLDDGSQVECEILTSAARKCSSSTCSSVCSVCSTCSVCTVCSASAPSPPHPASIRTIVSMTVVLYQCPLIRVPTPLHLLLLHIPIILYDSCLISKPIFLFLRKVLESAALRKCNHIKKTSNRKDCWSFYLSAYSLRLSKTYSLRLCEAYSLRLCEAYSHTYGISAT